MKNTKIYIILLIGLLFGSCESLLDVDPSDKYSEDTFWKTEEHAVAGLTGVYNALYPFANNFFFEFDMITSNAKAYNEANGTDAIAKGVHTVTTPLVVNLWTHCYTGIGRANTFLDRIDAMSIKDEKKRQMKGEALFLRAFFYASMVDKFGSVPLILSTPNAAAHGALPRDTKEKCIEQILTDLTMAAGMLETNVSGNDLGRATKGAALAMKARVLLYEGRWAEAASAASEVIALNKYRLFDDYRHFWFAQNKYNSEVIFDIGSKRPERLLSYDHVIYRLNRPAPLKELVDTYLMDDGETIEESSRYDPANPYENRDPRLHYTIACIGYPFNGKTTTLEDVATTGFGFKKYTAYEDNAAKALIGENQSDVNPILIRYAEVLLTYAEAKNEAAGPVDSVYAAINEVRDRVGMPDVESGLNKDQMREVIRRERRIELAMEGLYYSDILRWKTAEVENDKPVHNYKGEVLVKRSFNPARDYLWPVPYNEFILNPNLLPNNPEWR